MADDPEIAAMGQISKALSGLGDPDAVRRVLKWAIERFQPTTRQFGAASGGGNFFGATGNATVGGGVDVPDITREQTRATTRTFLDVSELFDAAYDEHARRASRALRGADGRPGVEPPG